MNRHRIRISARAAGEIERAARWWRKHRDKAPAAFHDDFEHAIEVIRANPTIGQPVDARPGVRRYWLDRVRYFIFYREPVDGVIEISSVWHASRGSRPKL